MLIILAQAPLLLAIDCNSISPVNYNICMEILNSNITEMEKGLLISNLDYPNQLYPNHNLVYDRNINLVIKEAPTNVPSQNGTFIKKAWMSIFAAMPSVLYNNSLYVPNKTSILCGFNYEIQIPQDYSSPGYPTTNNGDCRRINSLSKNISENKVFVNGIYQGSGRLVNAIINSDSNIKAEYNLLVEYSIYHYSWNKYCCKYRNRKCIKYCYSCNLNRNEKKQDKINISDNISVKYFPYNLSASIQIFPTSGQNAKFELNHSNSIELSFKDSQYSFYEFVYSINYSKDPYYVYTLKAQDYNQESQTNILKDGNIFLIKNYLECHLKSFDFFYSSESPCNLNGENFSFYITTNKLTYSPNETINIQIFPKNITVLLKYGNYTKEANGTSSFIANISENKISADYNGLYAQKIIFVSNGNRILFLSRLTFLAILIFMIYSYLSKRRRFTP